MGRVEKAESDGHMYKSDLISVHDTYGKHHGQDKFWNFSLYKGPEYV